MKLAIILATVLGLVLASSSAFADTDSPKAAGDPIFMNYGGITGDGSTISCGGSNSIEISSFQWGVSRETSSPTGGSSDREASTPSVSEIVVTKPTDSSSPLFLKEALAGTAGKTVQIDFCSGHGGNQTPYLQYTLTNTLVSKYSISSGGDRPTESISLNFEKITMTAISQTPNGTPITASFDVFTDVLQ
jgi:type VI secretion system secreted protein Hcp